MLLSQGRRPIAGLRSHYGTLPKKAIAATFLFAALLLGTACQSEEPAAPAAQGGNVQAPFSNRLDAPAIEGGTEWFNTAGPLDIKDLRGKFVLLDFWTYCCINCMHILPELKKLEHAYPNELVVIGVHSAKFDAEQDSKNIREAILRYEIEHPVVNDANHAIWDKFYVTSWPSLRLIDPEGKFVGGHSGEITFEALKELLERALPYYRANGSLDTTPLRFDQESEKAKATPLRFPGKVLADEAGGRLFIADSNHNRIVIAGFDGKLIDVIGAGSIGRADGDFQTAQFDHPQGMALVGDKLYVADTENHLLRKVDLTNKTVTTIAGTGRQARAFIGSTEEEETAGHANLRFRGKPLETALNSPWDLLVHKKDLYIAMAGPHQIWRMPLDEATIALFAGNGREDIVDGHSLPRQPYQEGIASFAQPSGLASDGNVLFVADSEGSSIRSVPFGAGKTKTLVGTAHLEFNRLFTFGDVDGAADEVRLQHPLGLAIRDKELYIADTYNNKIKRLSLKDHSCATIAGTGKPGHDNSPATFDEPSGLAIAAGKLYVADTNNHLIRVIDLDGGGAVSTLEIAGLEPPQPAAPAQHAASLFDGAPELDVAKSPVQAVDGKLRFAVEIQLPVGYKINAAAPAAYEIALSNPQAEQSLVAADALNQRVRIAKPATKLALELPVSAKAGEVDLKIAMSYFYCQEGNDGVCKAGSVAWKIPVVIRENAKAEAIALQVMAR
ncbi:MAG: redoxin domain-containing protein [Pirellulales bacterium]|nr:redoxin domain-containing protein [Pirellulales bacterium]